MPITGYGPGFFRVGELMIEGAVLVLPERAAGWGGFEDTQSILDLADQIDVLLLGMGPEIAHPPDAFRSIVEEAGLGVEAMSSPAACRTYNVLLGEGRRIGAALLPVL